jgi:hypothetical protein
MGLLRYDRAHTQIYSITLFSSYEEMEIVIKFTFTGLARPYNARLTCEAVARGGRTGRYGRRAVPARPLRKQRA